MTYVPPGPSRERAVVNQAYGATALTVNLFGCL